MYSLTSENLSGLGGSMGTERTWANWVKYFNSIKEAKAYAEKDYTGGRDLVWSRTSAGYCSPDLGYVMYWISKIKTEDK